MAKQVVRYRTCDRCPGEVPADVIDKVSINGERFDLDLCTRHSLEMAVAIGKWTDHGTKTGDSSTWDRQRPANPVTVDVTSTKKDPVIADLEARREQERRASERTARVKPLRTVLANDPDLPLTASRWHLTTHVQERMEQRSYQLRDVLWAAERPETVTPGKDGIELRRRGTCEVRVDPYSLDIITVVDKGDPDDDFIDLISNDQRKVRA